MKPSEFDSRTWAKGGRDRQWVIREVRRRPPAGVWSHVDALPPWARRRRPWLNHVRGVLLNRDGEMCTACGADAVGCREALYRMSIGDYAEFWLEVDHIVALTDDGPHALSNMRLLCPVCHKAKSSADRTARIEGSVA